jgi:hypothetical protein
MRADAAQPSSSSLITREARARARGVLHARLDAAGLRGCRTAPDPGIFRRPGEPRGPDRSTALYLAMFQTPDKKNGAYRQSMRNQE